jgi:hypothetical protein
VTETEWLACTDPTPMLEFLGNKASERKLRLFAVACARRIWHLFTDERSRRGVEIAERWADQRASDEERQAGRGAAHAAFMEARGTAPFDSEAPSGPAATVAYAAYSASGGDTEEYTAWNAAEGLAYRAGARNDPSWVAAFQAERAAQCDLLRDLFGKPFRPVTVDPAWLSWNDGEISKLAQGIYEERRWGDQPRLAEALSAAGCQDEDMLAHCRHPGEHARGCWVVDALLGKEGGIKTGLTSYQDWLACSSPTPMLAFLKGRATDRQWRLFAVACCRRIRHLITDERSRNAVEVAERFANGETTEAEVALARAAADEAQREAEHAEWSAEAEANFCYTADYCRVCASLHAVCAAGAAVAARPDDPDGDGGGSSWRSAVAAVASAARSAALASSAQRPNEVSAVEEAVRAASALEAQHQSDLVRDIFGCLLGPLTETSAWLPFKDGTARWSLLPSERAVAIDPSWLTWAEGVVVKLAWGIYEEQAFDRLPILADALEEAGCDNEELLAHCRQQGTVHVRGCWAVDACLRRS